MIKSCERTVLTSLFSLTLLWGPSLEARQATAEVQAAQIVLFEGFDDDFQDCRNVPDLVDSTLSSSFSGTNATYAEGASGMLTLRDRDVLWSPGMPLFGSTDLDFTSGGGTYVTFKFVTPPSDTIAGGTVSFDVVRYGDDRNLLYKFVSSDGLAFTQVGTTSDTTGTYTFAVPSGTDHAFLRIREDGNGVHIDNVRAVLALSSPVSVSARNLLITTIHRGSSNPYPGIHDYTPDTTLSVAAIPYAGYNFSNWELDGVDVGSADPVNMLMDDDHVLHAVYTAQDTMHLAGFWRCDNGQGTVVYDCSGNGNNGTLQGGATWVPGLFGSGLEFDGVDGFAAVPDNNTLDIVRNLSIDTWIKPYVNDHLMNLVSKWGITSGNNRSYVLNIGGFPSNLPYGSNPGHVCLVLTPNGGSHYILPSTGTVAANQWTHIIAMYDGATMSLYINGVLDTTRTTSMGPIFTGNATLQIGAAESEPTAYRFNGIIDEVRAVGGPPLPSPICTVSPTILDYGEVRRNQPADLSFTIKNHSGGTLTGSVSEGCSDYSIVEGGGSYALGGGASRTVTVRFSPTSTGIKTCTIETGSGACSDVSCTGVGLPTLWSGGGTQGKWKYAVRDLEPPGMEMGSRSVANVPTLTPFGFTVLGVILLASGLWFIRGRQLG